MSPRLVFAVLVLCALACKDSVPALAPQAERFDCHARALAPLAPSAERARVLMYDVYSGKATVAQTLQALNASAPAVLAFAEAIKACEAKPAPTPSADAGMDAR